MITIATVTKHHIGTCTYSEPIQSLIAEACSVSAIVSGTCSSPATRSHLTSKQRVFTA
ncbi:MAG: hypothetical protein U0L48_04275 [Acutalibacteraceae bacterium]|nr:hypothetical protein [Acutalibacteraceae bacterium]